MAKLPQRPKFRVVIDDDARGKVRSVELDGRQLSSVSSYAVVDGGPYAQQEVTLTFWAEVEIIRQPLAVVVPMHHASDGTALHPAAQCEVRGCFTDAPSGDGRQ